MTTSIFDCPKSQWNTLLQQRSWADLCDIDFAHVMQRGSIERIKIFLNSLTGEREELEHRISLLSEHVTSETFNNEKWCSRKICTLLDFLLERNRHFITADRQCQPHASLIEAVVRHSDYKTEVSSHNELLALAVVRNSDLLNNLLQRMNSEERSKVAQQLFLDNQRGMAVSVTKVFFTRTTAQLLPEFADLIVKHMCDNLRWDIETDLSISQRVKLTASNIGERLFGLGHLEIFGNNVTVYDLNKIVDFNHFAELHSEALSPQHWKDILRLFKKVAKKYDVSHVNFLESHALKDTLQKQVSEPRQSTVAAPPKRKM